jgi:FixJ family two-component response regulator
MTAADEIARLRRKASEYRERPTLGDREAGVLRLVVQDLANKQSWREWKYRKAR